MAIDTRFKRFNMMDHGCMGICKLCCLFEADSAVDADDRAMMLGLYGGNTLAGAGVVRHVGALLSRRLVGGTLARG